MMPAYGLISPGRIAMELYDVMRTTFSAREFTNDPLPDATLHKILDAARFAPSGGNRQGWYVIVVRERVTREALAALTAPAAQRYIAQLQAGESPWNAVHATSVDQATIDRTPVPARLTEPFLKAAVVLVVCVDLQVVAATDQYLQRVGVISGASIYPFIWNILLAARHEGYGGTITTLAVAQEARLHELFGLPAHIAVCALMPLGKPVQQLTRLTRKAVSQFAMHERWGGAPFTTP
jgi:nitroreductase